MYRHGKHTHLPVVQIGAFLACEFDAIVNLVSFFLNFHKCKINSVKFFEFQMEHKKMSLTEKLDPEDKEDLRYF